MQLSDEQRDAVQEIEAEVRKAQTEGPQRLLLVQAVAGSGKSTTPLSADGSICPRTKNRWWPLRGAVPLPNIKYSSSSST